MSDIDQLDISEELKESLRASGPSPLSDLDAETDQEIALTTDQWKEIIQAQNEPREAPPAQALADYDGDMQTADIGGVTVRWLRPNHKTPGLENHVYIHFHGGAYILSGGPSSILEPLYMSKHIALDIVSVDYAMPPDHPAPAACEDGFRVYQDILKHYTADRIFIGGTSAGAGVAIGTLLLAKQAKLPMPAAMFAGTPWADISKTGDTLTSLAGRDRVLGQYEPFLKPAAKLYAGDLDLLNPIVSSFYGDLTHFPPTFLVSGTRDLLLSDTVRLHRKLRRANVDADLHVFEAHSHAEYVFSFNTPEATEMFNEFKLFLLNYA